MGPKLIHLNPIRSSAWLSFVSARAHHVSPALRAFVVCVFFYVQRYTISELKTKKGLGKKIAYFGQVSDPGHTAADPCVVVASRTMRGEALV